MSKFDTSFYMCMKWTKMFAENGCVNFVKCERRRLLQHENSIEILRQIRQDWYRIEQGFV